MAKADLGIKLFCDSCGARFYDLNKTPGICPKCGTANARPVIFKASRRVAETPEPKKVEPPLKPKDNLGDIDDGENAIEDTSDLGNDEDVDVVVKKKDADT